MLAHRPNLGTNSPGIFHWRTFCSCGLRSACSCANILTFNVNCLPPCAPIVQVVISCDKDGAGVTGGVLHVLDLATGKILSTFSGMAETESSAAVGHDGIFVGSMDGGVRKIV